MTADSGGVQARDTPMSTTAANLVKEARDFSWSKIAVADGVLLTDNDIFGILVKKFGDDPAVWLALFNNRRVKRVVGVHRVVTRRCVDLHVKMQALPGEAPPPKAELEALLRTLVA